MKEPEITLFGRKILFPENGGPLAGGKSSGKSSDESNGGSCGGGDCDRSLEVNGEIDDDEKQILAEEDQVGELSETKMQEKDQNPVAAEESQNPTASSQFDENPKTPSIEEDATSENNQKPENEQTDAANGPQKPPKKPDKILPCPRCSSMDTKFCYYNNYNVNQPRHFCKSCQRYWTAGGTMRNVPVGAGRRKNKNASHCRHITITEALQAARIDPPNGFLRHPDFKPNSTVLTFGHESPLCESMASALNLAEKIAPNGARDSSCKTGSNTDDGPTGPSVTTSGSVLKPSEHGPRERVMPNLNGVPYPVPCIPGVAWQFPALPLPAICPPAYPMPFYPAPYWNCGVPNTWNVVPWVPVPLPSATQKGTGSGPNSPLGKHSRNGELLKPNGSDGQDCSDVKSSESAIVVPKTLRIDDPEEAAKSSIWETLGIKYDSVSREGLFRALQPKGDEKKLMVSASPVLHANPAALSRSISFQENA